MKNTITVQKAYNLKPGQIFSFKKDGPTYTFGQWGTSSPTMRRATYTEVASGGRCSDIWILSKRVFLHD